MPTCCRRRLNRRRRRRLLTRRPPAPIPANPSWNFTPAPGWTKEEAQILKLCLMKHGVGRWVQILDSGLLPGKMIQQLNGQTQRLLGQQSLAAYTGLQVGARPRLDAQHLPRWGGGWRCRPCAASAVLAGPAAPLSHPALLRLAPCCNDTSLRSKPPCRWTLTASALTTTACWVLSARTGWSSTAGVSAAGQARQPAAAAAGCCVAGAAWQGSLCWLLRPAVLAPLCLPTHLLLPSLHCRLSAANLTKQQKQQMQEEAKSKWVGRGGRRDALCLVAPGGRGSLPLAPSRRPQHPLPACSPG